MHIIFYPSACLGRPAWICSCFFVLVNGRQFVQFGGFQSTDPPGTSLVKLAGTLTLSKGKQQYEEFSAEMLRGFRLFAARANNEGTFSTDPLAFAMPNGSAIRIEVLIIDDEGDSNLVAQLYSQMMVNSTADLYLAPYGSFASHIAATQTENASKVIMATTGDVSVYNSNFTYVFSTTPTADSYMKEALHLLHAMGASQHVSAVLPNPKYCGTCFKSRFYNVACQSALQHAIGLGFQSVATSSVTDLTIHLPFYTQAAYQDPTVAQIPPPDVLLACGYLEDMYEVLGASRAEDARPFLPKAMVGSYVTNQQQFIMPIGPQNVNYLMGPVSWNKDWAAGNNCALFGSAGRFAEKLRLMFPSENATDHTASAAAGLYALIAAVAQLGGTVPSNDIRRELLGLNLSSFYGRLKFTNNGTLANRTWLTEQIHPLSTNYSRMERFRRSATVYVGDDPTKNLRYPMPDWEEKLVEIFPCDAGAQLSDASQFATCELCRKGRFRSYGTACLTCAIGSYSDVEGATACEKCPVGAHCDMNQRGGIPLATASYYKLPHAFLYQRCDPPSVCLQGNVCQSPNAGVMCNNCVSGYTKQSRRGKPCKKCPHWMWIWAKAAMVFAFLTVILVGALENATHRASKSVKVIFSIILKKIVNHAQLCATTWLVCDFEGIVIFNTEIFRTASIAIQDPFELFVELDCISNFWVNRYEIRVVVGLLLIPTGLLLHSVVYYVALSVRVNSFFLEASITKKKMQIYETHLTQLAQDDKETSSDSGSNSDGPPRDGRSLKWSVLQDSHTSLKAWRIIFLFVFHPIVMSMLLDAISCVDMDVKRLEKNLDYRCTPENMTIWQALSVVGMFVYGFGIPILLGRMLWLQQYKLHNLPVRNSYGFLYNGFEQDYYYFEIVHMFRKVLMLCWNRITAESYLRKTGFAFMSMVFLAVHFAFAPHDKRDYYTLDRIETTSLLSVLAIMQLRFFFFLRVEMKQDAPRVYNTANSDILDVFFATVCVLFQCWFWKLVLMNWFRSFTLKRVHLKATCIPEKLSDFQRVLMLLEPHMNFVKLRQGTHELDMSRLTRKERRFLFDALCATLQVYIESDRHFHPGRIVTAVRRAFQLCADDRSTREQRLIFDLDHHRTSNSWLQRTTSRMKKLCRPRWMQKPHTEPPEKVLSAKEIIALRERTGCGRCQEDSKCTVEDFLNALMLCWPEIKENRQRLYVLDKAQLSVEVEYDQRRDSEFQTFSSIQEDGLNGIDSDVEDDPNGIDSVVAQIETQETPGMFRKLGAKEVAGLLVNATRKFDGRIDALRRRRSDQLQEMWLMQAEVAALHDHLEAVGEPLPLDSGKDDEPVTPVSNRNSKNQTLEGWKRYADVISQVLRGIHREHEAMEARVLAARLTAIKTVWEVANHVESKWAAHNKGELEIKIVGLLREKEGVELLKKTAAKCVTELRMMATTVRKDGHGMEGNHLEAIALKFSNGMISDEELYHVTKRVAGSTRASLHKQADNRRKSLTSHIAMPFSPHSSHKEPTTDHPGDKELLKRVADFVEHLYDLHKKHEAKTVAVMAHRLIELRSFRRQNQGDESTSDVAPQGITSTGDVLKVLKHDPNWRQMGPLAAQALKEMAHIGGKLKKIGLPAESNDVNKLVDELAVGLIEDYFVAERNRSSEVCET